jgi:Icc-related predicted phosphoesterase
MIIDCTSDFHGNFPTLEGGDLLIISGDLTAKDTLNEYFECFHWIDKQNYRKKILIAGNHDNLLQNEQWLLKSTENFSYLCDSGTEFEGLKIWGSPWTKTFSGMNEKCKAFTCESEMELSKKWETIPDNVDILVTHSPPFGMLDCVQNMTTGKNENVGSKSLLKCIEKLLPKMTIFGHIHEHGGKQIDYSYNYSKSNTLYINASHVNEFYQPVNKPVRIIL